MSEHFRISVRFLDGTFHGRGDGAAPEWPPSPLRLFQALTNAAARLNGDGISAKNAAALRWLEALKQPPEIFASTATPTPGYQLYVPDNVADLPKAVKEGVAGFRTEKLVRPQLLSGDAAVHYFWSLAADSGFAAHREALIAITRAVSRLGWGVDLVVADAAVESSADAAAPLASERWLPVETFGGSSLRVAVPGTFADLEVRHAAFLNRIRQLDDGSQIFAPVPPLEAFRVVTYRRENELGLPPYAIFALRQLDDSGFRSFDPVRRGLHVAAMLRHVAGGADIARSLGWSDAQIARLVHGHVDEESSAPPGARLRILPLPSIEPRSEGQAQVAGPVRRVLITAHGAMPREDFRRLAQRLDGLELIDEKDGAPVALLSRLPDSDRLSRDHYLKPSSTWATVTPVVLPGHDDPRKLRQRLNKGSGLGADEKNAIVAKLDQRIDQLLRKALRQAGYSEAIVRHAQIEWRGSGYWPGTDLASRYMAGDQHRRFRKLHIRIQFRDENGKAVAIPGPLCVGGGKFSGTGLFAAIT